jgi:hypothetical protein
MKSTYTTPKLCKSSKGWFVYFRFNGKQKRYKHGLNRIKNLKERNLEAKEIIKYYSNKLKSGWSPFIDAEIIQEKHSFIDSLLFASDKKKTHEVSCRF